MSKFDYRIPAIAGFLIVAIIATSRLLQDYVAVASSANATLSKDQAYNLDRGLLSAFREKCAEEVFGPHYDGHGFAEAAFSLRGEELGNPESFSLSQVSGPTSLELARLNKCLTRLWNSASYHVIFKPFIIYNKDKLQANYFYSGQAVADNDLG